MIPGREISILYSDDLLKEDLILSEGHISSRNKPSESLTAASSQDHLRYAATNPLSCMSRLPYEDRSAHIRTADRARSLCSSLSLGDMSNWVVLKVGHDLFDPHYLEKTRLGKPRGLASVGAVSSMVRNQLVPRIRRVRGSATRSTFCRFSAGERVYRCTVELPRACIVVTTTEEIPLSPLGSFVAVR